MNSTRLSVLILVLVEHTLGDNYVGQEDYRSVLILVLVEHTLGGQRAVLIV